MPRQREEFQIKWIGERPMLYWRDYRNGGKLKSLGNFNEVVEITELILKSKGANKIGILGTLSILSKYDKRGHYRNLVEFLSQPPRRLRRIIRVEFRRLRRKTA